MAEKQNGAGVIEIIAASKTITLPSGATAEASSNSSTSATARSAIIGPASREGGPAAYSFTAPVNDET